MSDLISVIMPAYNVGDYIEESIRSIQKQIYQNWELIVVNDGSTDNTEEIVRKIAGEDARIHVVTQKNGGVSSARNHGLELAKGKYIAFLDGDDFWEPSFLSELLEAKEKAQVEMAYCGYDHFYYGKFRRKYRYQFPSGWILPDAVKGTVRIHICAILVDKLLLDKNGIKFTEGCPIAEDWELIAKILTHAQVQAVPKSLMLYSVRPGSALQSKWDWKKHIHGILAHERVSEYIKDKLAGTDQLDLLLPLLIESTAYKTYRFFWRMVKFGYHSEALELLQDPKYLSYLEQLGVSDLKVIDWLKYHVVMTKNLFFWKIAKYIL